MNQIAKLLLVLILIINSLTVKSQEIIDVISKELAKNISKKVKKLPDETKIAITFFLYEDDFSDTAKTYLSIKLSKAFAQNLRLEIQKNKLTQKILFPKEIDNELYEKMEEIYHIPEDVNEAEYWKQFLDNQTPDYYLTGKYSIIGDYEQIQLNQIQLIPNLYGQYAKEQSIVVSSVSEEIKKDIDKQSLQKLNQSLNILSQTYSKLIDYQGEADFLDLKLVDYNFRSVDNYKLIVGEEYRISISLSEEAYIYAFYYDPSDKNFPFMSMLFPFQNGQDTFLESGNHSIPPGHSFIPDPPAEGQVFIKIFATKTKIPISFIEEADSEGYLITKFNDKNCTDFLENLEKISTEDITSRQITLLRTEK